MKKKLMAAALAAGTCLLAVGCGKADSTATDTSTVGTETVVEDSTESAENVTEEVEENAPEGMARNKLTGEWIDANLASKRPFACMIENTFEAWPHYGVEQADIMYEVPVEGGITRYMAVYQDYSGLDRIGSVRSCRPYYVDFASEYDAIYAHFGECIFAFDILETIDDLDGLNGSVESIMYYRSSDMNAPHNAYVSADGVDKAIDYMGYDTELADGFGKHFKFAADNQEVDLADGYAANVVATGYNVDKPWFVYNEEDGLYYRYAFKREEMDAVTGNQLTCKNIILQDVNYTLYTGSGTQFDDKYLNIDCYSGGKGQYITNGKAIDVTWSKASQTSPTQYFDANGNEIEVNQGKTWVCIILNEAADRVGFYSNEEEFKAAQ